MCATLDIVTSVTVTGSPQPQPLPWPSIVSSSEIFQLSKYPSSLASIRNMTNIQNTEEIYGADIHSSWTMFHYGHGWERWTVYWEYEMYQSENMRCYRQPNSWPTAGCWPSVCCWVLGAQCRGQRGPGHSRQQRQHPVSVVCQENEDKIHPTPTAESANWDSLGK